MSMTLDKLISKYQKSVKAPAFAVFAKGSAKQMLVTLTKAKLLTQLQQRTIARRMDKLIGEGKSPVQALEGAVEELFTGKLKVGVARDRQSKAGALKLSELREKKPGLSRKQTLLELRNAGVLSPQQTRDAAKHITTGMSVEQALVKVEAPHLLDELPEPAEEPKPAPKPEAEEEEPEEEEPEEEQEEAPAEPDAKEKPRTLADVVKGTVSELKADVAKIKNGPALKQLLILELTGKKRKSATEAIRERGEELGLNDDDFARAIKIHNDTAKGSSVEDAYKLGNVPEE